MSSKSFLKRLSGVAVLLAGMNAPLMGTTALAQGLFEQVAKVNDSVITQYEVQQRARFLQVLGAPGATESAALDALIDDRLRLLAARNVGFTLGEEGMQNALTEFAARGNLTTEEFVTRLESAGISAETLRGFVRPNVIWRDLIRARFGGRVQISEADIDRALAASGNSSSIRVLLSEIIMAAPPAQQAAVLARAEQIAQATTEAEFSAFARQFSATATKARGGRLDWVPLSNLPPQLRSVLLALGPGEVTAPLPIPGAIALFQLRDIEETDAPQPEYGAIEYAAYYMAGGRSPETLAAAERLKGQVDVCDDLYGVAKGQPEEALERGSLPPADIPQDIAIELAKLDAGEVSTNLTRADGQTLVFLMLCGRTAAPNEDVGRETVSQQLRQQRLQGFANSFLEELRSDARITRK